MKLNTDIRQLGRRRPQTAPTKRSMNLYFKVDRTTAPATAFLYILFGVVVVLALAKVLIYDQWSALRDLEGQAGALQASQAACLAELADYPAVEREYVRATLTDQERALADRMEILSLIDETLRPTAAITRISITGNSALVSFSQVTLGQAAQLVARLEQSPLVSAITVDTAASTQSDQSLVNVDIFFELAGEEVAEP